MLEPGRFFWSTASCRAGESQRELVSELAGVADGDVHVRHRLAFRHARQELAGHLRQQAAGQDVVDVAGAALDLGAAAGDRLDQRRRRR